MRFILSLILTVCLAPLFGAQVVRGPYVEDAQQTTAVIQWATDEAVPAWLQYGPKGKCSQLMAISPKGRNHLITLHGLIPNTEFCYKVYVPNNAGNGVQNPKEGSFSTLYTPERKIVRFLVIGNTTETGAGSEIKSQMAGNMEKYDSDFLIHTGNISSGGLVSTSTSEFFAPYESVLLKNPLFIALGEDEYGPAKASAEGRGHLNANYRAIHSMPWSKGTPSYYYIDTANVRIIFLDTNNAYDAVSAAKIAKGSPQYAWLESSLAATPAGNWKIVVMHHPVYSSGKAEDRLSEILAPLFESYKVNLVIQGHQGAYERTAPIQNQALSSKGGPIYITVAGSGKLFEPAGYTNAWSSKYFEVPHFAYIEIIDRKLSLRVFTHDNKRIDALDLHY